VRLYAPKYFPITCNGSEMPNPNRGTQSADASTAAIHGSATPPVAKQAVVVIHGMGEQRPMDTLKSFVEAIWKTDTVITANGLPHQTQVWSKPDQRTGSLELRRITTRESIPSPQFPGGVRTDFYELYWADLTAGSTWDAVTGWVALLLLRPLRRVPPDVRLAWFFLWIAALVVLGVAGASLVPSEWWKGMGVPWLSDWHWLLLAIAAGLGTGLHKVAAAYFGRVVRYTRADPDNIAARAAVRERGLKLLRALHEGDYYKRIVIVAHSLGTILAYDLISYFWAERENARKIRENTPEFAALCALETAAARVYADPSEAELKQYYGAQRELRVALASRPAPPAVNPSGQPLLDPRWLITDLVTLGSPLAHAEFLLAVSKCDLEKRKFARELPASPPFREDLDPKVFARACATHALPVGATADTSKLISFPSPGAGNEWELHHAAPFAAVRWTNIYDPTMLVFCGDLIGGPLARVFGPAIIDVDLKKLRGQSYSFTHTKYWEPDSELKHIAALRAAVNLLDDLPSIDRTSNSTSSASQPPPMPKRKRPPET